MFGRSILGLAVVLVLAPAGAVAQEDGDENLREQVRVLKARLQAQEQRLTALEAGRDDRTAASRERLRKLVADVLAESGPKGGTDFRVYWKEGLRFDSADGNFKLKLGGRIMMDWGWINGDELESDLGFDLDDKVEFRRVRLYASGDIYEHTAYKLQFDFAGGDADLKDAYLKFTDLPFSTLTVGHFKEPFSLEEQTSSKYITFMERAMPVEAFSPSRNAGIRLNGGLLEDRATYAVGMFRDVNGFGDTPDGVGDGGYNVTARVTGLPIYEDDGKTLVHVGAAYSRVEPRDDVRFRSRPEAHFTERFISTDRFESGTINKFGVESALVCGPFSAQAEYIGAATAKGDHGDPFFQGFYAYASYFLTGEHRKYSKSSGAFSRVKPTKNFRQDGGLGAWEVGTRYSYLDLNETGLSGERQENVTVGVNWYLNPNMRIMWNWVHPMVHASLHDTDILMMRFQVDF